MNELKTFKCVQHVNFELMISKLDEVRALKFCSVTSLLAALTCVENSKKCLFQPAKERSLEYYQPMPDKCVTYLFMKSFEKDGKQKMVKSVAFPTSSKNTRHDTMAVCT